MTSYSTKQIHVSVPFSSCGFHLVHPAKPRFCRFAGRCWHQNVLRKQAVAGSCNEMYVRSVAAGGCWGGCLISNQFLDPWPCLTFFLIFLSLILDDSSCLLADLSPSLDDFPNFLLLNVGNGWEWGNGIIVNIVRGPFPHSLRSSPVGLVHGTTGARAATPSMVLISVSSTETLTDRWPVSFLKKNANS